MILNVFLSFNLTSHVGVWSIWLVPQRIALCRTRTQAVRDRKTSLKSVAGAMPREQSVDQSHSPERG